jgi:hypothetical protein
MDDESLEERLRRALSEQEAPPAQGMPDAQRIVAKVQQRYAELYCLQGFLALLEFARASALQDQYALVFFLERFLRLVGLTKEQS